MEKIGLLTGFLAALFVEMYGIPLTIYLLVSLLGWGPGGNIFDHTEGHLLGSMLGLPTTVKLIICAVGGILVATGLFLMGYAWKRIHSADDQLVTGGIYSYLRHPQYTGLIVMILGFLIQWPTPVTLIMSPFLIIAYVRLALKKDQDLREKFGPKFVRYQNRWRPSSLN